MICPHCGAALQRLSGADGYIVDKLMSGEDKRRIHAIYACPRCEFAGLHDGRREGANHDRRTNRRRAGAKP